MIGELKTLSAFLKIKKTHNDGAVFRLHYTFTVILLMAFCLIVSTKMVFSSPIDCIWSKSDYLHKDMIQSYCWVSSTFTVPKHCNNLATFNESKTTSIDPRIHPCIGKSENEQERKWLTYYQWVGFLFLYQALSFYFPRWLWKSFEGGRIHAMILDMNIGIEDEVKSKAKKNMLTTYLWKTRGLNDRFPIYYFLCECLAFCNIIIQFFVTDIFLAGQFKSYGWDVLIYYTDSSTIFSRFNSISPMTFIFPRMASCRFEYSGPTGNWQFVDILCLLELNIINEKLFLFLWYWYIILSILTAITLSIRMAFLLSTAFRNAWLQAQLRVVSPAFLELLANHHLPIGDWFLIFMLGSNIDPIIMRDILESLADRYDGRVNGEEIKKQSLA